MTIREWQEEAGRVAREKGFKTKAEDIHRSLLLMVGEITEAQNELRNGKDAREIYFPGYFNNGIRYDQPSYFARLAEEGIKPEGFPIELADVALRLFNLVNDLGIDLQSAIELKHVYNKTRPAMHGGKKF